MTMSCVKRIKILSRFKWLVELRNGTSASWTSPGLGDHLTFWHEFNNFASIKTIFLAIDKKVFVICFSSNPAIQIREGSRNRCSILLYLYFLSLVVC